MQDHGDVSSFHQPKARHRRQTQERMQRLPANVMGPARQVCADPTARQDRDSTARRHAGWRQVRLVAIDVLCHP